MYLARPRDAEDLRRRRLDVAADWGWKGWRLRMGGAYAGINLDVYTPSRQGVSYLRGTRSRTIGRAGSRAGGLRPPPQAVGSRSPNRRVT